MNIVEIIGMAANIATAAGVFFGVYSYVRDTKRKAKQDTVEAYNQLRKDALNELNKPLSYKHEKMASGKDGNTHPAWEDYGKISGYLTYVESFCSCVNSGIYDFNVFYELAHGYFDSKNGNFRKRVEGILKYKKEKYGDDYYKNLNKVLDKMEEEKIKEKRKRSMSR